MLDTVSMMFQQYFGSYFNSDNERKQFMTELNYEDEYNSVLQIKRINLPKVSKKKIKILSDNERKV